MEDTTEEVAGGLSAPVVAGTGALKDPGIQLGGLKGVKLAGEDSATIRGKLQEMIAAREAQKGGFDSMLGYLQSFGGRPEDFVANRRNYATDVAKREGETFDMRTQLAQMNTNERLAQQTAQNQQNFFSSLAQTNPQTMQPKPQQPQAGGGPLPGGAPQPQAGGAAQPQAGGLSSVSPQTAPMLTPAQQVDLAQLYPLNPQAAITKKIELQRASEAERQLQAAGYTPGTPEYNAMLTLKVAGAGAFTPNNVRTVGGTMQQTPLEAASQVVGGAQRAPVAATGVPPTQPAGSVAAPQVSPQGNIAPVSPQGNIPPATANTGMLPGSEEDLAIRTAEAKTEAETVAKASAEDRIKFETEARQAASNLSRSQEMQRDIKTAGGLVGQLAGGGMLNGFLSVVDQGISAGQLGSVNMAGFKDALVRFDPESKDPAKMDAYTRLAKNVEQIKLEYTRKVMEKQGSITENERKLIANAVGDVTYTSKENLMRMAKAAEIEARNSAAQDRLWKQMKDAGYSWQKFRRSPDLAELQKNQYYKTAETFGIKNPPPYITEKQ